MANKTRPRQVMFRVNEEEYQRLQAKVAESGKTQQEYILDCVMGKEIINTDGIKELVPEVKRLGVNLNQIAKALNGTRYYDYRLITKNQKELMDLWQSLKRYLQKPE